MQIVEVDVESVLNHCVKHLMRANTEARHVVHSGLAGAVPFLSPYSEAWRFPIVEAVRTTPGGSTPAGVADLELNRVTFVWAEAGATRPVEIVGTFSALHTPLALTRISDTPFYSISLLLPTRQAFRYKFRVEGAWRLDPVNPQRERLETGAEWSRFFTERCSKPLTFERWERIIMQRLASHILPFRTSEGDDFMSNNPSIPEAYRFDRTVGSVNYIDKILAREESHHLVDYRTCLELIDDVLRERNPYEEPGRMNKEMFVRLYEEMGADNVSGWERTRYQSPAYFLGLLRRHVYTGAFCHPRHGGNALGIAWLWLEDRYQKNGNTLFDWRRSQEPPYGNSPSYAG